MRNFLPGSYYHIYNRGAHKAKIFLDQEEHKNFLDIIKYYLKFPTGKPLSYLEKLKDPSYQVRNLEYEPDNEVESSFFVVCFCLMPNHFHLLVKQETEANDDNSISNFMRRTMITYAMYFNEKHDHSGSLFQGRYKNVVVDTENQLVYLTKYIHLNPGAILKKRSNLSNYKHSSYNDYLGAQDHPWLNTDDVLKLFSDKNSVTSYKEFVEETSTDLSIIGNVILD